jgi:hypothetical protein
MAPDRDSPRQEEAERRRSDALAEELALAEQRLLEAELSRSEGAGRVAELERKLEARRRDDELLVTRAAAPLRLGERAVRWLVGKLVRIGELLARRAR